MKNPFILLLLLTFISCGDEEEEVLIASLSLTRFPQKWELVMMTGSLQDSQTRGDKMAWQENYIFYADGAFKKTRERNNEVKEASGTYSISEQENNSNHILYHLVYNRENGLIGSCSGKPEEYLHLDLESQTLLSDWQICDGPGLYYEQVTIEKE
ncbi:hypothetical protein [Autumnicola musiva]|uniref:Lipocalin-like domain-containing protein n=1 Tax=Autumnicola musiva TaxID=3075589 RepID=A0ABU3D9L3_9FLAO|nr:hypothetical protein [Zunongwangia sp. F117]MDT0678212.1 hypothetical protein [Zunongwangia sp. F117]